MSTPDERPNQGKATYTPVGGTIIIPPQPNEPAFPLRREQFDLLCEGEVSEQRTVRDICVAVLASSAVGLVGLLATIDWDSAVREARKAPFIWTAILAILVCAAAVTGAVAQWRVSRTRAQSGYSRVKRRISDFFERQS
jgi:hypothetical protein